MIGIHRSPSPPFDWKERHYFKKEIWRDIFWAGVFGVLIIEIIMLLPSSWDNKLAYLEVIGFMGVLLSLCQIFAFFVLLLGRRFWQERAKKMIQEGTYKIPRNLPELILYGTRKGRVIWDIFFNYSGFWYDFFLFDFSIACFQAML
jgi:hypothetical protein